MDKDGTRRDQAWSALDFFAIQWGVLLVLKLVLTPLFIGAISLAGRRWGPAITGWLVGLPLTSGPVIFFLAMEQGTPFAAQAAKGTILGLISVAAFILVYARLCTRAGWPLSTVAGWCAYLALTVVFMRLSFSLTGAFFVAVAALAVTLALLPQRSSERSAVRSPRSEIFLRMFFATALVLGLTGTAKWLGPGLSGLIAPFPVYSTILAAFTHRSEGGAAAARLLRGVVFGSFTFALFFFVLAGMLERLGIAAAFTVAGAAALVLHGYLLFRIRSGISLRYPPKLTV